jgi:hypothetical protein
MRIVFDLQCCQAGIAPGSIARVQELVRHCAPHEAWIALSSLHPSTIESLRLALAGLLPPERIRVYELPPAQTGGAELIRENFFAALGADVVYTPRDEDQASELQRLIDAAANPPKLEAKGQKLQIIDSTSVRVHQQAAAQKNRMEFVVSVVREED